MSKNKFPVFPSRYNLVLFKQKVNQAERGWKLLKGKKDSLEMKLRSLREENLQLEEHFNILLHKALFAFAQAKFIGWDNRTIIVENPGDVSFKIAVVQTSVAGVKVPSYVIYKSSTPNFALTGLGGGGQHVHDVREAFLQTLEHIIKMAFVKSSVSTLKDAAYKCNIRLNGLEFVMVPKLEQTLLYITSELDETDREDTYRLKKSMQATIKRAKAKDRNRLSSEMANLLEEIPSSISSLQEFYECIESNRAAECDKLSSVFPGTSVGEFFSAFDYYDPKDSLKRK